MGSCSEWSCEGSGIIDCCKRSSGHSNEGEIYYLFALKYLDVYRMVGRHCTRPVRMVTVELLECCWRPKLTSTKRLM